ncbi:bactofilin family protein [Sphingomonas psychrolutea]|nr:polymer-forming cytoskeletal protein [Sphingomonas psychrolutea]
MSMFNNGSRGGRDGGNSGLPSAPPTMAQASGGKRGMFSVIGSDMVITGNVAATADLHIDGRVEGDIACGNFVQGNDSHIKGAVRAESARLGGSIEGSVSVRQLTIERAARITGDVEYESIAIETGASIDGRLKHIAADSGARTFDGPPSVAAHRDDDVVQFTTAPTAA